MRKRWFIFLLLGIVSLGGFGAYLWTLYGHLTRAFSQQQQFIPTRIYSDVAKIAPLVLRSQVETRLKNLGYKFTSSEDQLEFTLHPIEYPIYLIPDGHPTISAQNQVVDLHFEKPGKDAPLHAITVAGHDVPELCLEPELVATLSRSGSSGEKEIREIVKFDDIPPLVYKSIIAIEDQHFLDHKGLDPRGIARAIWVDLRTRSFAQGGSTITLQLVKNLMARRSKNIIRKVNELFLALLLEARFDKEQILERYLNEVNLGQIGNFEVHGVAEGAEHFFGKKLGDLNLAEIALMAALVKSPFYYSPYRYHARAMERQKLVLKKMVETGQIAQAEADAALKMPIHLAPPQNVSNKAPYFTDFVKAELIRQLKDRLSEEEVSEAGFRVYTTLDPILNGEAQAAVSQGIQSLETRFKVSGLEGALASVDQSTGEIRALIGGRSYAQSTFNRILNMKRQVGSTFKPIVYLTAFEKGEDPQGIPYSPGHPAEDAPWSLKFDHGRQTWAPRNYEKEYMGWISYRTALAHSINTITARLGLEIGIENVIKTARILGIKSDLPTVPSLSLGVAELSPIEVLRVYGTIANHGVADDLTVIRAITHDDGSFYARFIYNPKEIFDPAGTDLLTDMMQNVFTEGTAAGAKAMGFDRPAAGKTGTTSHHRDAWFAGFTPQLTTVVWVGFDEEGALPMPKKGQPKLALTGATSALPIWVAYMKNALAGQPVTPFPDSPHLVKDQIDPHTGKQSAWGCSTSQILTEKFIQGHEPKDKSCESGWPASLPPVIEQ